MAVDSFSSSLKRNSGKLCKADGCCLPRSRVGTFCRHHEYYNSFFGHPHGHDIPARAVAVEREQVSRFVDAQINHPGIIQVVSWFSEWLEAAGRGDDSVPGHREMVRLYRAGVKPLDCLKAVAVIWLYSARYPASLPSDNRLTVALSRAITKLAPMEYRTTRTGKRQIVNYSAEARRNVGRRVRDTIGILLTNMADAITTMPDAKAVFRDTQALPFSTEASLVVPEEPMWPRVKPGAV
jgi:hypothetical protein